MGGPPKSSIYGFSILNITIQRGIPMALFHTDPADSGELMGS